MRKRFLLFAILLCLVFSIGCSAGSTVISDTDLEFQICENVTDFDFSNHQPRFGLMGGREYYGTGYTPTTDADGMQIDPDACVIYTVTAYPDYASRKQHITRITITDPAVKVYGITLQSTADDIDTAMKINGFKRKEYPNANGISYAKGKITVHFTDACITITAAVTNFWGIQF